jgi:hypothetical protein
MALTDTEKETQMMAQIFRIAAEEQRQGLGQVGGEFVAHSPLLEGPAIANAAPDYFLPSAELHSGVNNRSPCTWKPWISRQVSREVSQSLKALAPSVLACGWCSGFTEMTL